MLRVATALMSPAKGRGRLSALIFHRVLPAHDPMQPDEPDAAAFEQILQWVKAQFDVLDPVEACERLQRGALPARAAVITFDDGYRDNVEIALPILLRQRVTAAFFIATGYLGTGIMFNDRVIEAIRATRREHVTLPMCGLDGAPLTHVEERRHAVRKVLRSIKHLPAVERLSAVDALEAELDAKNAASPMMNEDGVRSLRDSGMRIGAHTRNHPILRVIDDLDARREVEGGRDDLRAITGEPPALFAYPNGKEGDDFDARHVGMVREAGFIAAFTTHSGTAGRATDRFRLPRFTPWRRKQGTFHLAMLRNLALGRK